MESLNIREAASLGSYATVFQAEVYAILMCSGICQRAGLQNERIHILSDSKAALMALSSYRISSSIVLQCWEALQMLSVNNRVRLSWVPGHSNIAGNEMADKMAREGSDAVYCGPEPFLPLTASTTKSVTKKWADNAHKKHWESVSTCRQSKLWLVEPTLKVTRHLLRLSRATLRNLVSAITGHGNFRKHLHRMRLAESPFCGGCELEDETAFHIICECPSFSLLRIRTFGQPMLDERQYKMASLTQIQEFITRRSVIDA